MNTILDLNALPNSNVTHAKEQRSRLFSLNTKSTRGTTNGMTTTVSFISKTPSSALPPLFFGLEVRTLRQQNLSLFWKFSTVLTTNSRDSGWNCTLRSVSLQDFYQDIRRLISLACPNDVGDTSERLAINQFTYAFHNEDMCFEVLNKNPTKLETALYTAMRYEALKPSHSAPQGAPATDSPKEADASAFIYNDKGRTKDSARAQRKLQIN